MKIDLLTIFWGGSGTILIVFPLTKVSLAKKNTTEANSLV